MTRKERYVLDLDQFEGELMALLTDLRVDEKDNPNPVARQAAYESTAKRHGFLS
jgi:hypothetical protein